jgi:hypothetical protein
LIILFSVFLFFSAYDYYDVDVCACHIIYTYTYYRTMDLQERNRLARELQQTKANDAEFNRIRRALLDGLARGETTREGESQHAKLESVERNIRENLRVMHDLEVILADHAFNQ